LSPHCIQHVIESLFHNDTSGLGKHWEEFSVLIPIFSHLQWKLHCFAESRTRKSQI
jgi:hypothetical protein